MHTTVSHKRKQKVRLRQLNNLHEGTDHENITCISFPKEYSVFPVHKTIYHPEVNVISKLGLKMYVLQTFWRDPEQL